MTQRPSPIRDERQSLFDQPYTIQIGQRHVQQRRRCAGHDRTRHSETGLGRADVRHGTDQWLAAGLVSLPLRAGAITVTPAGGVIVSRVVADAFAEEGAQPQAFRISGDAVNRTFVSPVATISASTVIASAGGIQWIPDLSVGYRRSSLAHGTDYVLVAEDGTAFAGNAVSLDRDVLTAGGQA